eukprot:53088_1
MMNYQQQTPYSYNASYGNNMSPITASSTSTNSHCYGANMMDNNGAFCNANQTTNCNVTPCFNETVAAQPQPLQFHSMDQSYTNNQYLRSYTSTNYYPSSANASCRSSCDDSISNDNANATQTPFLYPNDAMMNGDKLNVMPNIQNNRNSMPDSSNNTYTVNQYYAPCTNYNDMRHVSSPRYCNYTPKQPQGTAQNNVSLVPFMQSNMTYDSSPNNVSLTRTNECEPLCVPPSTAFKLQPPTAFIKNSKFIYGSYKQKYAQQYGSLDIKQELYRHRRQSQYDQANEQSIKVKIKGSNFESLVQRLTRCGDKTRCIECNKSFLQKCHLLRHVREIHLVKPAVHECPFCPKTFHQKSNLDTHCMTHAKDRKFSHPFKCLVCAQDAYGKDKAFTRKSSLKRHCQAKHKHINVEADWINNQQTPKWDQRLKTFVFHPTKKRICITKTEEKQLSVI